MNNWEFLKKYNIEVFCICLTSRDDKFQIVSSEFEKVGLLSYVQFHRPEKNTNSGLGCFLAHKYCLNESKKHVLVFEDDVKFTKDWCKKIQYIVEFLENTPNYDSLRLGCFLTSIHTDEYNTSKVCLSKSYMTHAILYHNDFKNKLLNNPKFNGEVQIDDFLHNTPEYKEYSLIDPICYQRIINSSDNIWQSSRVQKIIQSQYIYENIQWLDNIYISNMRCLPPHIQEKINLWYLMYFVFN
jgi:GR25 family glycosyltransferase involved in LPS biosynthesis